jgi:radical SAM superfamily enzyme YgiQ (UPF0313 family)
MNNIKVLFINPNPRNMSLVPPVVSLFYSIFKESNIDMKFFDTTFYDLSSHYTNPDSFRQESLEVRPYEVELIKKRTQSKKGVDVYPDFRSMVESWQPDVIMASAMESTITFTIELLRSIRDLHVPTVLGGVFATFVPEMAIDFDEVDIVCIGEGESVIVPLCKRLASGKKVSGIPNLWVKEDSGNVLKSPLIPPVDINKNPRFDASIIDDSRFYRAMAGKIYKMFPVETHRGCPCKCTFCNSPLQSEKYKEESGAKYFRKKSVERVLEDIYYFVEECQAEYFFFWADNFLSYSKKEINEFCEAYADIKIPFYIQLYPSTIDEYKIKRLCKVGLDRIGIGIEHGNENFRRKVIKRVYSNEMAINGVKILKKHGVQFSCNNIVGFPTETPELHMDTVKLNHILKPHSAGCSIFTPFHGTPLRELAIKLGYLKDPDFIAPTNTEGSILEMPNFSKEEIIAKSLVFNFYIKFPKNRWRNIKRAEVMTPEGAKIRSELREEYLAKYCDENY